MCHFSQQKFAFVNGSSHLCIKFDANINININIDINIG